MHVTSNIKNVFSRAGHKNKESRRTVRILDDAELIG